MKFPNWPVPQSLKLPHCLIPLAHCLIASLPNSQMVAREGFEPSKALGRQIYSLLRLTASLPRQKSTALAATPQKWSWRRDLNPRPADYKSAALPD